MPKIHPTAIVHPDAQLGAGVSIGPYSLIGQGVVLEDEVEVAGHVVLEGPMEIGSGTRIFPFASLGQAPQDLKYRGEPTRLVIGRRNTIREYVTINRGTVGGGGVTRVGDDNLLMAQCHVAHDCLVGSRNVFANVASLAGHVVVEDDAILGAFVGVHQFCRIGTYAFIGGFSKIVKDALPYARTDGAEAKCYGVNTVGLRRKGFSPDAIRGLQQAFRWLLTAKLNTSQAVQRMRSELAGQGEVDRLMAFIEQSTRGVTTR
jgi:UDP-N-acetylglucosamine acyltransferase